MNRFVRSILLQRQTRSWLPKPRSMSPITLIAVLCLAIVTLLGGSGAYAQDSSSFFDFKLINSELVAAQSTIAPGQDVLFTVILRNDATTADSINVTVQHPTDLAYVSGSGGTYDAANRAISWTGIPVAANGEARRTFKLRIAGSISSSKSVQVAAAIAGQNEHIIRWATVTLQPGGSPPPTTVDLSNSGKRASVSDLGPGGTMRYTITLRNTGNTAATVNVTDPLPANLSYNGSVNQGGSYSGASHTVSWSAVAVAANASVDLFFDVKAPATISTAASVVNTATIAPSGLPSFTRSATIQLKPTTTPAAPRFDASFKLASRLVAQPNQTIDYQIVLYNNGTADGTVTVTDQIPAALIYDPGSAAPGASFDATTNTLTWNSLNVQAGQQVTLRYTVMVGAVTSAAVVENTAKIDTGNTTLQRSAVVLLRPASSPPSNDVSPPSINSLKIGDDDVLTDRGTTVHIQASDNVGVEKLYLREWVLNTNRGLPHWQVVQSSGWIDYKPDVDWTLGGDAGTHYVGAWVKDAAGNVSMLSRQAIDFASLVVPGSEVNRGHAIIYQVYYPAGTQVTASTTPSSGDVDLYVWYPHSMILPDAASTANNSAIDTMTFNTPTAGMYIIAAVGYTDARFDMAISPSGGPRTTAAALDSPHALASTSNIAVAKDVPEISSLLNGSIDPLGSVSATTTDFVQLYMPLVFRN